MFQKVQTLWEKNQRSLRLLLLLLGVVAMVIELFFPFGFILEWRESFNPEENLAILFAVIGGGVLATLIIAMRSSTGSQLSYQFGGAILILFFFVLTIPFAPPIWSIVQSIALGMGFIGVSRYRF
jgi:hypothetical protein